MEESKIISRSERLALLAITSLVFFYFGSSIAIEAVRDYNCAVSEAQLTLKNRASGQSDLRFATHDFVTRAPAGFHIFTLFIMLSLIRPKMFTLPALLTLIYAFLLILFLYFRVNGERPLGGNYRPDVGFFGELYIKTQIWDYVGALYVLIALPWLFSIRRRISNQRISKRVLP